MKTLLCSVLLVLSLGADDKMHEKQLQKQHHGSEYKETLSKEEKYQKYEKELEERNKKLEDDGFCACSNE